MTIKLVDYLQKKQDKKSFCWQLMQVNQPAFGRVNFAGLPEAGFASPLPTAGKPASGASQRSSRQAVVVQQKACGACRLPSADKPAPT